MKKASILLLLLIPLFAWKPSFGVYLDINIYHAYRLKSIDFEVNTGQYDLVVGDKIIRSLSKGIKINITPLRDSVLLQIDHHNLGLYKEISFVSRAFINAFNLSNLADKLPKRNYEDNLKIKIVEGKLQLINHIDLEHYVAGVIQSESGGSTKALSFFMVQAITCRTYSLVNYMKHAIDGYNLCDEVHCQHYRGKASNPEIIRAVAKSNGMVIVDQNKHLISAAYHSNCGGETVNSEDVWTRPTSYLKARTDTFCKGTSNSIWTYSLEKTEFLSRMGRSFKFPTSDSVLVDSALHFTQAHRKVYFVNKIPLKLMRREFMLKSTYFNTEVSGNKVIFLGKGYGHGIGLCQQGAIRMAELGYDYTSIIQYYYSNTKIVHFSSLKYDYMPQY